MKSSDFDYDLPESFIAQNPVVPRDSSRLLVFDSKSGEVFHRRFSDISDYVKDDVLVLNSSKVVPARIVFYVNGWRKEIFYLKSRCDFEMRALVKRAEFFRLGREGVLEKDDFIVSWKVVEILDDGTRIIRFDKNVYEVLDIFGDMPLPPYIDKSSSERDQYQTVYSDEKGSVAAPTAGLHFTQDLMDSLVSDHGVSFEKVLLHVGRGTFSPMITENVEDHVMHSEEFELFVDVAKRLNLAKIEGRNIVAVGTTSVRVLESCFVGGDGGDVRSVLGGERLLGGSCLGCVGGDLGVDSDVVGGGICGFDNVGVSGACENIDGCCACGEFVGGRGETDVFIYPGKYDWKTVDKLITNFHLPQSTLIMLVASFLEHKGISDPVKKILELYEIAKNEGYRFYSFGDGMIVV